VGLNVQYKPSAGCLGNLVVQNCTLRGGSVEYAINIDGPSSSATLAPGSSIWDDVVVGPPDSLQEKTT